MNRIDDVSQRIKKYLSTFLNTPEADLADPLRVGGFGRNVMGQGCVDLVGDGSHETGYGIRERKTTASKEGVSHSQRAGRRPRLADSPLQQTIMLTVHEPSNSLCGSVSAVAYVGK